VKVDVIYINICIYLCMLNSIGLIMIGTCQCLIPWSLQVRHSGSRFSGRDIIPWPLLVGDHGGAPSIWSGKDSR